MKALLSFETLGIIYQSKQYNSPEYFKSSATTLWKIFHLFRPQGVWVSKRISPPILNLRTKCRSVVCFTLWETLPLGKKPPILTEWVAEWAPESVCAFRKREKSLAPAGRVTSPQPSYYTDCAIPTHAIPL